MTRRRIDTTAHSSAWYLRRPPPLRGAMRIAAGTAIAIIGAIRPMHGQVPAATPADSVRVQNNIFHQLFAGITLTPDQGVQAQKIIAKTYYEQVALSPAMDCTGWKMLVALQDQRDSTLRAMLVSDSDKAKFDRNAAAAHPVPCVPRE